MFDLADLIVVEGKNYSIALDHNNTGGPNGDFSMVFTKKENKTAVELALTMSDLAAIHNIIQTYHNALTMQALVSK